LGVLKSNMKGQHYSHLFKIVRIIVCSPVTARWFFAISVVWLATGCAKKSREESLFSLQKPETTGISFSNTLQSTPELNILEYLYFYNGGGVALGDINNDGLVDIYFSSNQGSNKLYLNKGNFQFEDITESAQVTGEGGWSTGVTMADVNGDGFLDLYVCQVGDYKGLKGQNRLYINQGDLTFREISADWGLNFVGFSTHSIFFDYDQDGDLDMYLLNHSIKKPEVFSHADTKFTNQDEKGGDRLYRSLVAQGENRMVEVTAEAGILSSSLGFGLGVGIGDFNADGWMDIYVSNDFTEDDYLYINQHDGTFREALKEMISNTSRYSMGNDVADIDGDGLPDIFTTDMLPADPQIWMKSVGEDKQEVYQIKKNLGYGDQYVRNHLQLNRGDGRFSEVGLLTETFATDWSWSPLVFDMDNDGLADIHVTNGIVKRPNDLDFIQYSQEPEPNLSPEQLTQKQIDMLPTVKLPNFAFKNEGNLKFSPVADSWGLAQESYSNGSAYADLDNDGDLDLVINNTDQEAFVYQNKAEKLGNHFLQIDLKAAGYNRFGLGAQVWVYAGDTVFYQTLSTSRGFQSGPSTTLTFGLGKKSQIDSVLVAWDAKNIEHFNVPSVNQKVNLEQGKGKTTPFPTKHKDPSLTILPYSLPWSHTENFDTDEFRREYLLPRKYGTEGPALAVGDVNGDGLEDIFLGGAKGQAASLFFQTKNGDFEKIPNPIFEQLSPAEDVVAEFADFNGDGHLDLYIGSAGNEHKQGEMFNFDRIFLNDGTGNLRFSMNSLPPIGENTSTVAVHDVNGDGAPDIFVGASVVTGNYGAIPKSYLLINDGRGIFREATNQYFGADFRPGMVQKALWADINGDGNKELILVGEWMGIQIYGLNQGNTFELIDEKLVDQGGWNYSVSVADIDEDGKPEILVGALGLNTKLKASPEKPLWLYHHDVDGNGQEDPLIFHYMGGNLVPFATRDDLIKQIPMIKRKHKSYVDYAQIAGPEDLFEKELLDQIRKVPVKNLSSGIWWNKGKEGFQFEPFPVEALFSPIRDMVLLETGDGSRSMVAVGNFDGFRNDLGRSSAQAVQMLTWSQGGWKSVKLSPDISKYWGEYRKIVPITIKGEKCLIAVRNNDSAVFMKINP
jgi:enediyne biosynthesis protein E4